MSYPAGVVVEEWEESEGLEGEAEGLYASYAPPAREADRFVMWVDAEEDMSCGCGDSAAARAAGMS